MKSKYNFPIEKDIFTIYVVILLTALAGAMLWAKHYTLQDINSQQPIASQVKKMPSTKNQNIQPPALTNPTQAPKVYHPAINQPTNQVQVTVPFIKVTQKPKVAINRLEPEAYWLKFEGEQIKLVSQKVVVKEGVSKEIAIKQAFNSLFTNSQTTELTTTIPQNTKLLSLKIDKNKIHVNLSTEFTDGGGSDSMIYRVAQVIYTASSIDPKAKVYIYVEGQLLDEDHPLGGEGLVLTEPLTRQQLAEDFSIN
jgi:spore germination protein GerM